MTTRLPLRIEPMPGEWWRGYLLRVAAMYGVDPLSLLQRLHGLESANRRHMRWVGIAMSEPVAKRVGAVINLEPEGIQAMHLSAYNGSALDFAGRPPEGFDPALAFTVDRLPLASTGPLVNVTHDRYCPRCQEESPGYRAKSWRLQVHLVCTRHGALLSATGPAAGNAAPPWIVDRQAAVLSRLVPSRDNRAFFEHLYAQLVTVLGTWKGKLHRMALSSPETALEAFDLSVTRVLSPGYPDYQGLGDWPLRLATRHLRAPRSWGFDGTLDIFPHLLPMDLFTAGLSDLLQRNQIRPARAVAALGTLMSATGLALGAAAAVLPPRRRGTTSSLLLAELVQLERDGRAERFWTLCTAAASQLVSEAVDYRHREQVCPDEEAYLAATSAEPSAYARTVRTWLVDQWACTYTSSNVRPSVRDGSIEHFDRLYGAGMRASLARLFEESAA